LTPEQIRAAVKALDTASTSAEEVAWLELKPLGIAVVPYLVEAYASFKKWQGRTSLVFHSIRYARVSEEAFQLGLSALKDKSTVVRYRACSLLAYSMRQDALPSLTAACSHPDSKTVADAIAAVDAIRNKNHHLFVDRSRSGSFFWVVNDGDREA
jgi:hypothetical protein